MPFQPSDIKIIKHKQTYHTLLFVAFNCDQSLLNHCLAKLFSLSFLFTIRILNDQRNVERLTLRCLPLKTTANAPWPIRSFVLYSQSPTISIVDRDFSAIEDFSPIFYRQGQQFTNIARQAKKMHCPWREINTRCKKSFGPHRFRVISFLFPQTILLKDSPLYILSTLVNHINH